MPNWCDTTYCCTGERENLESLRDILDELSSVEGSCIPLYLVVDKLGGDSDSIGCRGVIESYRLDDKGLWLYQSTAWNEQSDFREFLEKTYPGMVIYYSEIEPMEDIFYTNDSSGNYISTRYIVDLVELGWEYFDTIDEAVDYISMNLGISPWDVPRDPDKLGVWLEEADECFSLHKIEVV